MADDSIPGELLERREIPAGQPWSGWVSAGDVLRIVDVEGSQAADFLCYNAIQPEERYHAPNTIKAARRIGLGAGDTLYSDIARPLMTIIGDTCGNHDTIGGCCSAPSNAMLYDVDDCPGCRENFLAALGEHGLGRRDIVPNVNFFANVPVHDRFRLSDTVFEPARTEPGAYVDLRADMDVLAVISNCPQINNPCNAGNPTALEVIVWKPR